MVTEVKTSFDKLISKLNTVRKALVKQKSIKSSQTLTQRERTDQSRAMDQ